MWPIMNFWVRSCILYFRLLWLCLWWTSIFISQRAFNIPPRLQASLRICCRELLLRPFLIYLLSSPQVIAILVIEHQWLRIVGIKLSRVTQCSMTCALTIFHMIWGNLCTCCSLQLNRHILDLPIILKGLKTLNIRKLLGCNSEKEANLPSICESYSRLQLCSGVYIN